MPLLIFDVIKGRSEAELKTLLDSAHRAVLTAFKVPVRDRYQIVHENNSSHMIIEDTGLGLRRTTNLVVIRVITSPRDDSRKQVFMHELCRELKENCGIESSDVMISFITNTAADWSFGNGVAQYVTGDL